MGWEGEEGGEGERKGRDGKERREGKGRSGMGGEEGEEGDGKVRRKGEGGSFFPTRRDPVFRSPGNPVTTAAPGFLAQLPGIMPLIPGS